MTGESPISIMRGDGERITRRGGRAPVPPPRRSLWRIVIPVAVLVALAVVWCGLWYYAAGVANRTLAGWIASEAAAGRVYTCGSEGIGGFPFSIQVRCVQAAATIKNAQAPFDLAAKDITFTAQVYRPTVLVGDVVGPVTVAAPGQAPSLVANWSSARMRVDGLPPNPEAISINVERPHLDRGGAGGAASGSGAALFVADNAALDARIVSGTIQDHPVIDFTLHFAAAAAPTVHPLLAEPLRGDVEVVVRGFKDLEQKPLTQRLRELQADGGSIELKTLRLQRADAIVVGSGKVTVNANGRLDGMLQVAVYGLDAIVPQLGIDRVIEQRLDELTGPGQVQQGLSALDRLMPGLSGIVRQGANASLVDDVKKMGQPTEIDSKPAVALPLRFTDGTVYLGLLRIGDVPPLF
jgi:hypothetical protein